MNDTRALHPVSDPTDGRAASEAVLFEIRRVIVGQDAMLERVLVALLSGGHLLLEGVPGLAKTLTVKTLADVLDASFRRIQFTPDLVPADLVGTRIYRPDKSTFDTELGPVFCNFLLADEINRAPAKVQSALLEVMQERQVTIGPETFPVPRPFLVMATQNPIEAEGTYPLPEAQVDRFMMKVRVDYPSAGRGVGRRRALARARPPSSRRSSPQTSSRRSRCSPPSVYVGPARSSTTRSPLTRATREPESVGLAVVKPYIAYGASPRGSINLIHAARALAVVRGRRYVIPSDVTSSPTMCSVTGSSRASRLSPKRSPPDMILDRDRAGGAACPSSSRRSRRHDRGVPDPHRGRAASAEGTARSRARHRRRCSARST